MDPSIIGFELESVPIASHLMLTPYPEGRSDDGRYDDEPIVFTNPFSADREILLPDSTLQAYGISNSYVTASYYMEQDFDQWVEYDGTDD